MATLVVISPVVKLCANPDTYPDLSEDTDVGAGRLLDGRAKLAEVGAEIFALIQKVTAGAPTRSEELGHQELILGYKSFAPLGPSCLPV